MAKEKRRADRPDRQNERSDPAPFQLETLAAQVGDQRYPPVHMWNPEFCGDIDMRIARDGTWYYMGTPITRQRLVRLFSTVLRHDADGKFYLVTPVEKLGIVVDDAPFLAVAMERLGDGGDQTLTFRTQTDDLVTADADHPIRVAVDPDTGEPSPYVLVRDRLEALIHRPVFYDLVDLAVPRRVDGVDVLGVWSGGAFHPLGTAEA